MRAITIGAVVVCMAAVVQESSTGGVAAAADRRAATVAKSGSPLACNIRAMPAAQRNRHFEELGPMLRTLETRSRELPDGYEFVFSGSNKTFQLITEWATGERLCCPFFRIEISADAEGGPVVLRLTGRAGVKEFIREEGATWLKK